jgi:hypothetical protein
MATSPSGPPDPHQVAEATCDGRLAQYTGQANPRHVTLVASYPSTAGDVSAADAGRHHPYRAGFNSRPSTEFAAVCFFDADFFDRPPLDESSVRQRREEIVLSDGTPSLIAAAPASELQAEPVPARSGS